MTGPFQVLAKSTFNYVPSISYIVCTLLYLYCTLLFLVIVPIKHM